MDVQKKLDEIVAAVEGARSMPMSASCVVNRAELLTMLQEVREALPGSLAQAQAVLGDREEVLAEARREAQRIVESAHAERGSLISDTQVARQSQDQADRILDDARREAEEVRAEADDYVDSKLANFEVVLTKTLAAVDRGREKLLGRGPGLDEHGEPDAELPERSSDPDELRRQADAYVDAKMASFEAVLGKTLEAVGRGRLKLLGRRPIDDLADYTALADQQQVSVGPHQSDAEFVAALAGQGPAAAPVPPRPQAAPAGYDTGYGDAYQDGYDYGYAQPDGYAAGGAPQPGQQPDQVQQPPQPAYAPEGYGQDEYGAADAYGTQPGYAPGYGWQPGYDQGAYQTTGYDQPADGGYPGDPRATGQHDQPAPPAAQPAPGYGGSLDETSFFDTSVIDVAQLRELDQRS
ncbi:cell division initiation protein [Wenjunlia vitaminophila]|uniref:Cell division initiation protein n=1 Tax=Wenjunlia vitaminophila TaxID=76728 RepID=A0A0T6LY92_WENVI|nr:ATP synthase F0 subunit B [Wenjunlia vitaminophila]KRV50982.1 cell division initiation protein [Wenjunlia vitaminophila]